MVRVGVCVYVCDIRFDKNTQQQFQPQQFQCHVTLQTNIKYCSEIVGTLTGLVWPIAQLSDSILA